MNYYLKINLLAIFGAVLLLLIILPYKLGFSPDSITYLEVTKNLIAGKGIVNNEDYLVNHWPPLYPMAVGFISLILNVEEIQGGIILQIFLFYSFLLGGMLIYKELKINEKLIPFYFFCLLFSQVSINFLDFLSEGLFLVFLLLSFYFFIKWRRTNKWLYMGVSAFLCSLMFLSRYAGIAFVGCYLIYIVFLIKENIYKRFKSVIIYSGVFFVGILPWFIYQSLFVKPPVGRKIGIHIIPLSKILDLFKTVGYWFFGSTLAMVLLFGISILILYKWKIIWQQIAETYNGNKQISRLIFLFLSVYPLFLVITISFFDSWTPLDNRMLSPLLVFLLILIFLFFQKLYESREKVILMAGLSFLILSFSSSIFPALTMHYEGRGYSKRIWVESQTLLYLKNNPIPTKVVSNGVELGKLHLKKDYELLPRKDDNEAINSLFEKITNGEVQIVYFDKINWRNYLISAQEIKEHFNKKSIIEFEDGFIIKMSPINNIIFKDTP